MKPKTISQKTLIVLREDSSRVLQERLRIKLIIIKNMRRKRNI